jgi:hypothetical protein
MRRLLTEPHFVPPVLQWLWALASGGVLGALGSEHDGALAPHPRGV